MSTSLAQSRTARSYSAIAGANERLRIGIIGCGGMANSGMHALLEIKPAYIVGIAAICDVYGKRLDQAAQKSGGRATTHYHGIRIVISGAKVREVRLLVYKKKGAEDIALHHRNLQAAIRQGETLHCDVHLGCYGVVAAFRGVQSFRQRNNLRWDHQLEKVESSR